MIMWNSLNKHLNGLASEEPQRLRNIRRLMYKKNIPMQTKTFMYENYAMNVFIIIKLRMEMGNVSKRQQHDHRTDNSRSQKGLQSSEKLPHLEASFSCPLKKYIY